MKKLFFFFSVILVMMFASCEIETSDNGDFDGYWHLVSVDSIGNSAHTDLSEQKICWAVQMRLLQLRGTEQELYMRFNLENNTLKLYSPYLRDREKNDPKVDESTMHFLYPYGINAMEENYQIVRLDNEKMILRSSTIILTFCKM